MRSPNKWGRDVVSARPRGTESLNSRRAEHHTEQGSGAPLVRAVPSEPPTKEDPMTTKTTPTIVRDAGREHPLQAALAELDRSIAEEQEFDVARRRTLESEPVASERGA